jgi:hypothetical protein
LAVFDSKRLRCKRYTYSAFFSPVFFNCLTDEIRAAAIRKSLR